MKLLSLNITDDNLLNHPTNENHAMQVKGT